MKVKISFTNPISSEQTLIENSNNFHQHPSHPSSCEIYKEFYSRKCPCESYDQNQKPNTKQQVAAI